MYQLTLSLFGTFQVAVHTQPRTHFRSTRTQGLLVYLALTPHQAHTRDALAAVFWPEESETTAKQNLRVALFRLRQLLEGEEQGAAPLLQITRATVQWNPTGDYRLDVASFVAALERGELETAVALYHGDLVPGFSCGSQPFEDWLRQERERYHRLALDALFKLTTQKLAQADFQTAQVLARKQLTLEPWREEAHRQLIQALALHGERSAAIAQYEACRAVLAEELGLEPSTETSDLVAQIRRQPLTSTQTNRLSTSSARQLTIPFVGRQAEYATLIATYQQVTSNGLHVVTLLGNAGIGKSRLVEHFLAWAAMQGADVLHSCAFETSENLSYQPLTQLLRRRLERENAPDDLLSDFWLSQLARLLPELRDRYPDLPEPTQEEYTAREHLFEAITRVIEALVARRSLVLSLDDWHWADAASLDVLHYAVVRWAEAGLPILLLLGIRHEAVTASPELQNWLTRLERTVRCVQLQLTTLSKRETEQLIAGLLEPEAAEHTDVVSQFGAWLFAETAGQPLFLTETLKALVAEGLLRPYAGSPRWQLDQARCAAELGRENRRIAPGIQQMIKGWLARISTPAKHMLAAASVLAQDRTFDQLCSVAELEEGAALPALDELLSKQVLLEVGSGSAFGRHEPAYTFSHQKVKEGVYLDMGAARRRMLHRRAFETLKARAAPAADLAHHAFQAGLRAETVQQSLMAGNEAMALVAVGVAVRHYQTAWQVVELHGWPPTLSGADRQALYTGLGRAYELTGAWPQAQRCYEAMATVAQELGSATMECLALNHLATVFNVGLSDPAQAAALLERARLLAEASGDQRLMAETARSLSRTALYMADHDQALNHAQHALTLARALDHPQLLATCLHGLAFAYMHKRQWELGEVYAAEAHQWYAKTGNQILAAENQRLACGCQIQTGQLQQSLAPLGAAFAFSQRVENGWGLAESTRFLALAHVELGNYGQAITQGQQAITHAQQIGYPLLAYAQSALAITYRAILALDRAQTYQLAIIAETARGVFDPYPDLVQAELCALHALAGEWAQAYPYARTVAHFHAGGALLPMGKTSWFETEALLRGGAGGLARAEVARVASIVCENRRYQLPLLRSQAVLAQWDGDAAQATRHLEAALALAQELELPGEAWPILGALGALYAERGDPAHARQAYQEAAAIIRRLAATIDEAGLRSGFLAAGLVRPILAFGEHS